MTPLAFHPVLPMGNESIVYLPLIYDSSSMDCYAQNRCRDHVLQGHFTGDPTSRFGLSHAECHLSHLSPRPPLMTPQLHACARKVVVQCCVVGVTVTVWLVEICSRTPRCSNRVAMENGVISFTAGHGRKTIYQGLSDMLTSLGRAFIYCVLIIMQIWLWRFQEAMSFFFK